MIAFHRIILGVVVFPSLFCTVAAAHGTHEERVKHYIEVVKRDPRDANAWHELALARLDNDEWQRALQELDVADALVKQDGGGDFSVTRARAMAAGGRLAGARDLLDGFLKKSPRDGRALLERARILNALELPDASLADYCSAMEVLADPAPEIVIEAAEKLAERNQREEALALILRAIGSRGETHPLLLKAMELEIATGRFDDALARVSRLEKAAPRPEPARTPARKDARASSDFRPLDVRFDRPTAAPAPALPQDSAGQLGELARLTGYRLHELGGGVTRLTADLGTHGYSVLVAYQPDALNSAAWTETAEYRVLLTDEATRPEGVARFTREALIALIEHARLAPLSAVDLRGYWKAGSVDLESAASVAEMVSAHLAQRGTFSFVLLTLAQQPAHSVVSVPRLAERLGSGVNYAELGSILDTLTRPPFLALTPLPAGQYLLRVGVTELLSDMAEYADVVRRRIRVPAPAAAAPVREREAVRA